MAVVDEPRASGQPEPSRSWRYDDRPVRWYQQKWLHLIIGVVVAVLTIFFAGQRATAGVRAAIDDRLIDAGAGVNAGLVAITAEQLSAARAVSFTAGVSPALANLNGPLLSRLVTPIQANSTVPMVDVVEPNGRVVLAVRSKGAPRPVATRKGLDLLTRSLHNADGARGGRYTELEIFKTGPTLVTISPIMSGRLPVGAVLAMTPLADALGRLSQEVHAELNAYDANGDPIATTAVYNPKPISHDEARTLIAGGPIQTRYVYKNHREKVGRLIIDHSAQAVLGVALVDNSPVTGRAVSIYAAIGLLCTVAIIASFWARFTRDWPRS